MVARDGVGTFKAEWNQQDVINANVFYSHYAHFVPTATFRCDENVTIR